jgi:uncharacterized protein (DUF1810 family)
MHDPHDLNRFIEAQQGIYEQALAEIRDGSKESHWMWFIFPQFAGLGLSATSQRYAIKSLDEARAYLAHPLLGSRLIEVAEAAVAVPGRSAEDIFGWPDYLKLRSCATLFASITPGGSVFHRLLDRFFNGERDPKTAQLLNLPSSSSQKSDWMTK